MQVYNLAPNSPMSAYDITDSILHFWPFSGLSIILWLCDDIFRRRLIARRRHLVLDFATSGRINLAGPFIR